MFKIIIAVFAASLSFSAMANNSNIATESLKEVLVDPESLVVKSVETVNICDYEYERVIYNARNRMGGYNGYTVTYYNPRNNTFHKPPRREECEWVSHILGDSEFPQELYEKEQIEAKEREKQLHEERLAESQKQHEEAKDILNNLFTN